MTLHVQILTNTSHQITEKNFCLDQKSDFSLKKILVKMSVRYKAKIKIITDRKSVS